MKVTAGKNLNVRVGEPKVTAPFDRCLLPGDQLEITSVVYGDIIEGNGIWYKSDAGLYYWSGGIYETVFLLNSALTDFTEEQQFQILLLLKSNAKTILQNEVSGYIGCGIGNKNFATTNNLCLIIYVIEKSENPPISGNTHVLEQISFNGISIPTDIIELPNAAHHYDSSIKVRNMEIDSPLFIGGGIQDPISESRGTRSLVVKRLKAGKTGEFEFFLLASFHVLLADFIFPTGGSYSDGDKKAKLPLSKNAGRFDIAEGIYSPEFDYAAVKLKNAGDILNRVDDINISEYYEYHELYTLKDKEVYMLGFKSGRQTGKVLSLFNSLPMHPRKVEFEDVLITEKLSIPGDSGAPVFESGTNKLIGFILGGDEVSHSYVIPFFNLKYKKKFHLNTN